MSTLLAMYTEYMRLCSLSSIMAYLVLMVLPPLSHVTVGSDPDLSAPLTAQKSVTSDPCTTEVSHGLITNVGGVESPVTAKTREFLHYMCYR